MDEGLDAPRFIDVQYEEPLGMAIDLLDANRVNYPYPYNRPQNLRIETTHPEVPPLFHPSFPDEEMDPDFEPHSVTETTPVINNFRLRKPEIENNNDDCAICLLPMELPVRFECSHEFCFVCAKGLVKSINKSCAMCRRPIPPEFVTHPDKFATQAPQKPKAGNCWLYKSRHGWWTYAPRMQVEIEDAFQSGNPTFKCLFNGETCEIDFKKSTQTFGTSDNVQQ